ncbi:MAG: tol-pal system-associated acyl-CoA thioesterase [Rhodocyclaceae bacterium]|nr:tol-pal system-associated acyl-CoA thioesterase [Rhodocyclaceae bacterium]
MTTFAVRVYYEDTDAGGVVYYANYLKYLERGRTEFLRALGFEQRQLAAATGLAFAVRSLSAEYLKPAVLDDELAVVTQVEELGRAQVTFAQSILRADEPLLTARVRVACLDLARGRAAAMPKPLYEKLKEMI